MIRAVTAVFLLGWLGGLGAAPQQVAPDSIQIEDADTLLITVGGTDYRIQLPAVDAPEDTMNPKLQRDMQRTGLDAETLIALGRQADAGLRTLLGESASPTLHFDPDQRDKYGRVPGDLVDGEGRWLSVRLVEAGFAIPMPTSDPDKQSALSTALAEAQAGRHGLWGSDADTFSAWAHPLPTPAVH